MVVPNFDHVRFDQFNIKIHLEFYFSCMFSLRVRFVRVLLPNVRSGPSPSRVPPGLSPSRVRPGLSSSRVRPGLSPSRVPPGRRPVVFRPGRRPVAVSTGPAVGYSRTMAVHLPAVASAVRRLWVNPSTMTRPAASGGPGCNVTDYAALLRSAERLPL